MNSEDVHGFLFLDGPVYYDDAHDLFLPSHCNPPTHGLPLSICISVGTKCNLCCNVCLSSSHPHGFLPSEHALVGILNELRGWPGLRVIFSGGEPLLHPSLPSLVEAALAYGAFPVVSTNATQPDSLSPFAGRIFYQLSIYAITAQAYTSYTHRRLFRAFVRNVEALLDHKHKITASLRVCREWRHYVPTTLNFLRQWPLRKLLVRNTDRLGRNTNRAQPVPARDLEALKYTLVESGLPCPIVYPAEQTRRHLDKGYLGISVNAAGVIVVSGQPCDSLREMRAAIEARARANRRLFTLCNYVWPTSRGGA